MDSEAGGAVKCIIGGLKNSVRMDFSSYIRVAAKTDSGKVRSENEDAFWFSPEHGVFVVADGIGGGSDGHLASKWAVEAVQGALEAPLEPLQSGVAVSRAVKRELQKVQQAIIDHMKNHCYEQMGSTVVVAVFCPESPGLVRLLYAGDSRAYVYRKSKLVQCTQDHHIAGNLLSNALGIKDLYIEERTIRLKEKDQLLLCTDGLSGFVSEEDIRKILGSSGAQRDVCDELIRAALQAGGLDNITVTVAQLRKKWPAANVQLTAEDQHYLEQSLLAEKKRTRPMRRFIISGVVCLFSILVAAFYFYSQARPDRVTITIKRQGDLDLFYRLKASTNIFKAVDCREGVVVLDAGYYEFKWVAPDREPVIRNMDLTKVDEITLEGSLNELSVSKALKNLERAEELFSKGDFEGAEKRLLFLGGGLETNESKERYRLLLKKIKDR